MKKILYILLVVVLSLTLISCGNNEDKKTTEESKSTDEKVDNAITEEKKDAPVSDEKKDNKTEVSTKQTYLNKLDKIKAGLTDLDKLYAGNTVEMKSAAGQEYERWDAALNEIYGVLKTQLSKSEMSALEKEELQWIKDKEAKANEASKEMEGGTAEPLIYTASLAGTTRDRCYELVNKYMK